MQGQVLLVGPFEAEWKKQLRKLGATVRVASGREALTLLEAESFDIVLVRGAPACLGEIMSLVPDLIQLKEEETEQSLFLRSILDNLPHMVFVKDAKDLRFVRWNKAGEDLIGISREDMVGKTDYDLFPADDAAYFQQKDREVLAERVLHDIPEETLSTKNGPRVLHTKKIPICNEKGDPLYLLGISEDITELKEMKVQAASRLEAAREDERRHIARELHDELGQLLTALKLDLGRLQGQVRPDLHKSCESMSELLDHTIKTVRRLATELRPQILDDLGLKAGLEWLIKQSCERKGVSYDLRWGLAERSVTADASSALFRICQEALNNVVRHSQADHVTIELGLDQQRLTLSVSDDGVGFEANGRIQKGLGLLGIQERIRLLGGKFQVDSSPDAGTRLTISAPAANCMLSDF